MVKNRQKLNFYDPGDNGLGQGSEWQPAPGAGQVPFLVSDLRVWTLNDSEEGEEEVEEGRRGNWGGFLRRCLCG